MNHFRSLFCQILRATIPDLCHPPQRQFCVKILQHGWQNGLISWDEWSDADVVSAALLLDDLQNRQLIRELSNQHAVRAQRRKISRVSGVLTAHMVSPWAGLAECVTRLQQADISLNAITELVADATESYINLFGRLLGVWPYSDVQACLRDNHSEPMTLKQLHRMAVHSSVIAGRPFSVDHLPGRVLCHMYRQLRSIEPLHTTPPWWNDISEQERRLIAAVQGLKPNPRFVLASVIWGGLRIGQIAAFVRDRGARMDVAEVCLELQSAWQEILPIV